MSMPGMSHGAMAGMDLNDIEYDAYLANDRTLDDPDVVTVEKRGRIRLRIINGATATGFTIDLGSLTGDLIAVDGQSVQPVKGRRFPMTMGQRLDIRLELPADGGAFPILALREGAVERAGVVLATKGASVAKLGASGMETGPILDLAVEQTLKALQPPPSRKADLKYGLVLRGDMAKYEWSIDGAEGLRVRSGQRVEVTFRNMSMMAHPMHLHGHHFQVVAVNGTTFNGAVRDTVLVPSMAAVTVVFDADNTGRWPLHCHHLYHMASGMMAYVRYDTAG
jgi:FtsP/CotA-like multicopper oxidase with cupredoxin domain